MAWSYINKNMVWRLYLKAHYARAAFQFIIKDFKVLCEVLSLLEKELKISELGSMYLLKIFLFAFHLVPADDKQDYSGGLS